MTYEEWMAEFNDTWIKQHLVHKYPPKQYIPRLLHLIWVGKAEQPDILQIYLDKWKNLMPHWSVRLWTNEDINESEFQPEILAKINEAEKGVQKADIMRYAIVEKYGGIYVDADMEPVKELDALLYMSGLVVCHDNYVTWTYINNAFFGAKPNHPVLKKAVELCISANLNTNTPNFQTGPALFGVAISLVPPENEKYTLLSFGTFYGPDCRCEIPEKFGEHHYAKNWDI